MFNMLPLLSSDFVLPCMYVHRVRYTHTHTHTHLWNLIMVISVAEHNFELLEQWQYIFPNFTFFLLHSNFCDKLVVT
jgi:hypothetical protein